MEYVGIHTSRCLKEELALATNKQLWVISNLKQLCHYTDSYMASTLIDGLNKPLGILEAITLAIITHQRSYQCCEALMASLGFHHHRYPSAEN